MTSTFPLWLALTPVVACIGLIAVFWIFRRMQPPRVWITGLVVSTVLTFLICHLQFDVPRIPDSIRHRSVRTCQGNLANIGGWYSCFCPDFPTSWVTFCTIPEAVDSLKCPSTWGHQGPTNLADSWSDYVLATNVTGSSPSSYLLAYCKPGNHRGGTYVVFIDCSVTWIKTGDFGKLGCDVANLSQVVTGPATLTPK